MFPFNFSIVWVSGWKEVFLMHCSHHFNLVRLRTTAYGENSLEFNIPSGATGLTIVPCFPPLIWNRHDFSYIFLSRHWCLSSITIPISTTSLQLGRGSQHDSIELLWNDYVIFHSQNMLPFLMLAFPRLFLQRKMGEKCHFMCVTATQKELAQTQHSATPSHTQFWVQQCTAVSPLLQWCQCSSETFNYSGQSLRAAYGLKQS